MSKLSDIDAAVVARIQSINGTGGYTYNFSTTGRIIRADRMPEGAPDICLMLSAGDLGVVPAETLTDWRFTLQYVIGAFAPATSDSPEARASVAYALLADLFNAFTAIRTLTSSTGAAGAVDDVSFEASAVEGQEFGRPGCGGCGVILTFTWTGTSL